MWGKQHIQIQCHGIWIISVLLFFQKGFVISFCFIFTLDCRLQLIHIQCLPGFCLQQFNQLLKLSHHITLCFRWVSIRNIQHIAFHLMFLLHMPKCVDIAVADHRSSHWHSRLWQDTGIHTTDKILMIRTKCRSDALILCIINQIILYFKARQKRRQTLHRHTLQTKALHNLHRGKNIRPTGFLRMIQCLQHTFHS